MIARAEAGSPWYRNSWPWFIVGILAVSVAGSLATVYIAFAHRDFEVEYSQDAGAKEPARRADGG